MASKSAYQRGAVEEGSEDGELHWCEEGEINEERFASFLWGLGNTTVRCTKNSGRGMYESLQGAVR